MLFLKILFWVSLFIIFYTYFGYLLLLRVVSFFKKKEIQKKEFLPKVSLIITVYNAENLIKEKLENSLQLDYPQKLFEIIVVSDGSGDRTEKIVQSFSPQGVKLVSLPERGGKHKAQFRGIEKSLGEIIVLTDLGATLEKNSLKNIVKNFTNPKVGLVSGRDQVIFSEEGSAGEGFYVRYEMKLRELESEVNSIVSSSGSFFAVRKSLCKNWYPNLSSDFFLPLLAVKNNSLAIQDNQAVHFYRDSVDSQEEFIRKVRIVVHGLGVLFNFKELLNPFKYGFFSLQLLSHKLLRWLIPYFMGILFFCNLLLLKESWIYLLLFLLQLIFYALFLGGGFFKKLKNVIVFRIPYFFVLSNWAVLYAWFKYFSGEKYIIWEPTKR